MPVRAFFENVENLKPRQRGFESNMLEILGLAHRSFGHRYGKFGSGRKLSYHTSRFSRRVCPVKKMLKILFLAAAFALPGCSSKIVPALTPYKMDIQQGNYVQPEALAKIKPGMTKSQVRFALGTPLVIDPFHANRWDYIYRLQQRGKLVEEHKVALFFEGDILQKIDTDIVIPAVAAEAQPSAPGATPQPLPEQPALRENPMPAPAPAP